MQKSPFTEANSRWACQIYTNFYGTRETITVLTKSRIKRLHMIHSQPVEQTRHQPAPRRVAQGGGGGGGRQKYRIRKFVVGYFRLDSVRLSEDSIRIHVIGYGRNFTDDYKPAPKIQSRWGPAWLRTLLLTPHFLKIHLVSSPICA
jgi:hypothetical protein